MSVFLEILRCVLCCEGDNHDSSYYEGLDRNPYRKSNSYNNFSSTSAPSYNDPVSGFRESNSYNTFSRTSAPSYNDPVHRPDLEAIIEKHNALFGSSTKLYKPPEIPSASSVKPRAVVDSGFSIKPENNKRSWENTNDVSQKGKNSSPSPPPPNVYQVKPIDPKTKKPSDQRVSQNLSQFSSCPPPSSSTPTQYSSTKPPPPSPKLLQSSSKSSLSSTGQSSSSFKPPHSSSRPTLSLAPSIPTNQQAKANYILVQEGTSPIYVIPKDIEDLIKKDIVPGVLKKPLSPSTYRDYFAALLYAEDFYVEKWKGFELLDVTLELHEAAIYKKSDKKKYLNESDEKDDKTFVVFELDSVRERRPFLLSRDFVFVRPSGRKVEPFQGIIYRVVRSTRVLVEFGEDFHSQHYPTCKYHVSFSFNRFCLKRAHQAVEAASDPLFQNFLFPNCISRNSPQISLTSLYSNTKLDFEQASAVRRILSLKSPPPYLLEGPLSVHKEKQGKELSRTGLVVLEAVLHLYRTSPKCRILVCAPTNNTCDVLMRSLKKEIRKSDMFRANAAFRELDGVPYDILPSCLYKDECFACPSLQELRNFKVILSTFVSSFRLHGVGITAGHFSHIFLLDASSTNEPETMVALANLANEETAVVVTGAQGNRSSWVRSDIARQNGLRISYFERLFESKLYKSSDPRFITQLGITRRESDDAYSILSFS